MGKNEKEFDVVVIGGGAGGVSACVEASKNGSNVLLLERDNRVGGILNQCIHNGFGLHYFKEELTGPEYATKIRKMLEKTKVQIEFNAFVTSINGTEVTYIGAEGKKTIKAKAVVLASGAMERGAGSINLAGNRPAGIMTAGLAQKFVNLYGKLPGKKAVILGSGDIGLIMARRLTFEGAKVEMVLEINSSTSGLARNVQQCVDDFNIPLLFNSTITRVIGEKRVEGVYYAQVDEHYNVLPETEKFVECDMVILSVGLTPDISICKGLKINPVTGGSFVNEFRETNIKGVFACGNALHIHDLVDNVSVEGELAGKYASLYAQGKLKYGKAISVRCGNGVRYVIPDEIYKGDEECEVFFRVAKKFVKSNILVKSNENVIAKKFCLSINPGEMQSIKFSKKQIGKEIVILISEEGER